MRFLLLLIPYILFAENALGQLIDTNAYNIWLLGYENPLEKELVVKNKVKSLKTYYTDKKGNKKLDYTLHFDNSANPISFYKAYQTAKRQVFYKFEFNYDSSNRLSHVHEYILDPDTVIRNTYYNYNSRGKLSSQIQYEQYTYGGRKKIYSTNDSTEYKLIYKDDSFAYILKSHKIHDIRRTDTIKASVYSFNKIKNTFYDSSGNPIVYIKYASFHGMYDVSHTESVFVNHYNNENQLTKREIFEEVGKSEILWEYLSNGLTDKRIHNNKIYFFEYEYY